MRTWKLLVEDKHGILAIHYQDAIFCGTAQKREETAGYRVISVWEV